MVWPYSPAVPTVADMPRIREEDKLFAERLGSVLRSLRRNSAWTREEAAEQIGVSPTSLGRWERGEFAPKGYDLGRLYRGYVRWGAQREWFLDPPEVITIDPVKARLDELEQAGATAADEREERVAARRRRIAERRAAERDTRPAGTRPRLPRSADQ